MGLFSSKLVDTEVAEWQIEWFHWLILNFSSGRALIDSELWLPTPEYFPAKADSENSNKSDGEHIFEIVKAQCKFGPESLFRLEPYEQAKPEFLGGGMMVQTEGDRACGTYQIQSQKNGPIVETISYDVDAEKHPTDLVATFAHELSHALHTRAKTDLDIEPELYELFTDLTAVYLGYGIFLSNSRFSFSNIRSGDMQGWSASGKGYLPEADLVFATALFMSIKSISIEIAVPHLKPKLQKMLGKAMKQLSQYANEVSHLRQIDPTKV